MTPDSTPTTGRYAARGDDTRQVLPDPSNSARSRWLLLRLFRGVKDEPDIAEPATPLFALIVAFFVLASLVALDDGGDVLAIFGLDFVAAAALVASPRFLTTGVVEEFDEWWLQSSFVDHQRRLGRASRRLNRLATLVAFFGFLPLVFVFVGLYLVFGWDPFATASSYMFVAFVLLGLPAGLSDLLFTRESRARRRESSEGDRLSDRPMTLKMAWEGSQKSPWAPAIALGLLVVGVVLQILATAF